MLTANISCDIPTLLLILETSTDGMSARGGRMIGSSESEKVTVTFKAFLGFLWCFITVGYFSIRTTSMA